MKDISTFILESDLDNIIAMNLAQLSDNDVIEDMRDYVADNVDPGLVLNIWNDLKKKLGKKTALWIVPPTPDIDDYIDNCKKWADNIIKKYRYLIMILTSSVKHTFLKSCSIRRTITENKNSITDRKIVHIHEIFQSNIIWNTFSKIILHPFLLSPRL